MTLFSWGYSKIGFEFSV